MDNHRILNFIPNFDFGGVENTNLNLSEGLINSGYKVDLVTNKNQKSVKFTHSLNIKSLGKSRMLFCIFPLAVCVDLLIKKRRRLSCRRTR